jgi:hypothetical protein
VKQAVRKFRKELESYIKSGQKAKALPVLAGH